MDEESGLKVLSCVFFEDVLCSYRKSEKFGVMGRCLKCEHYVRFNREMDAADEKMMDEIDEIQRLGYEEFDRRKRERVGYR